MTSYKEYSEIKRLIDEFFELKDKKRYEDFIIELSKTLNV
jgi:cobalamin biosynthesis Mg chelatase CobN